MSADAETIAFYDSDPAAYAQFAIDHGARESLIAFEKTLKRGADVLDLGCGGGQDSAWLRERGHRVVSMDASAGLAREAKAGFGIDVRVGGFATLDDIAAYDGVWSAAALHHEQAAALPAIVAAVATSLRTGGVFAATMKGGEDRRDAMGRFYCAMDAAAARTLFGPGWESVDVVERRGEGFDGVTTPWLIISARRA